MADRDTLFLGLHPEHSCYIFINLDLIVPSLELCDYIYGAKSIRVICCIMCIPEFGCFLVTWKLFRNWINVSFSGPDDVV